MSTERDASTQGSQWGCASSLNERVQGLRISYAHPLPAFHCCGLTGESEYSEHTLNSCCAIFKG